MVYQLKIAALSDFHLGVKRGSPREKDSFEQAREAIERALELDAQLILISGDIFDGRIPDQEVWSEAMKILSLASERKNQGVKLADTIEKNEDEITALPLRGTPVIAIHGNHERRGKEFVDSIEALESSGLIIRLHHNSIVMDTPDGKIAIHGMGYVPEGYAKDLLDRWKPKPVEDAINILMIHQGLGTFTYSSEERPTLKPADLPGGFDLYVSGHVHYRAESEIQGEPLIFSGSTIRTQLLPIEAERPKGFYMIDIEGDVPDFKFIELDSVRDFFYKKKEFEGATSREVEKWVKSTLEELGEGERKNRDKRPIVRFRLLGTLSKGSSRSDIELNSIERRWGDDFLISISREDLSSPDLEEKTQFLKDIRQEKISMEERGMKILESNLEDLNYDQRFDYRMVFNLLSEDRVEEAFDKISDELNQSIDHALEANNDNSSET